MIELKNLSLGYEHHTVLNDLNYTFKKGLFYGIIGPNSVGKTTLIRSIGRALKPYKGRVLLNQQNIWEMKEKETAKKIAVIPQDIIIPFNFTVYEIISMGRIPYISGLGNLTEQDRAIIEEAIEFLSIKSLRNKIFSEISGGEKQKVMAAKALAQQPEYLLMDEPISALDLKNQILIMNLVKDLIKLKGITVISVLHNINIAAMYADEFLVIKNNTIMFTGNTKKVITEEIINKVFEINVKITKNPFTKTPMAHINPDNKKKKPTGGKKSAKSF